MQLGETVKLDDLSDATCCDEHVIKLEQVAILVGVRQRLLQHEVSKCHTLLAFVNMATDMSV